MRTLLTIIPALLLQAESLYAAGLSPVSAEIRKAGFACSKAMESVRLDPEKPWLREAVYCDDGAAGNWYLVEFNALTFKYRVSESAPPTE